MDLIEKIKERAKEFFIDAKGCHDWMHTERVCALCEHIAKKEKDVDGEILQLAAVLHDIGRKRESEAMGEVCHAEEGGILARKMLEEYGFDKEKIDRVVHCIESHRFRKARPPQTTEAKILFDADKLEAIGAVGIGRAFLFAGEHGGTLHVKNTDVSKASAYTEQDTAYREFLVKLSKIKDGMLTKEGRRMAEARHRFMEEFFDRLDREVDGLL